MANLELLFHSVKTLGKIVTGGCIKLIEALDHAGELIALTIEQRARETMNLDLEIDKLLEVLAEALGLSIHLLLKRHTRNLFSQKTEAGLTFDLRDLEDLRRADARLIDAGEVQGLVEYIRYWLLLVEDLCDLVSKVVNDLVAAMNDLGLGAGK